MAILSDLVEAVAEVEGIDPATVGLFARYIREAGLIATHGRGPSAAKMSLTDAANLLIGVNATNVAADAARVVKEYRRLQALEFRSLLDPRPDDSRGALGDALEELLRFAGGGELPDVFMDHAFDWGFQEAFARGDVFIELRFRMSRPQVELRMFELPGSDAVDPSDPDQYLLNIPPELSIVFRPLVQPRPSPRSKKRSGDRIEEARITRQTLFAVGKLIG